MSTTAEVISVPQDLASRLDSAGARLPDHDDRELRREEVQTAILQCYRDDCGQALDRLVADLHERLRRPPFFVLLRGLDVVRPEALLVALSRSLGVCVEPYEEEWSRVVRRIEASRERLVHGGRPLNEFLHTDGTDWPVPNDYTCLYCVRPDQNGGGQSLLIDADEAIAEIERRAGARVVEVLRTEPIPWKVADPLGGGAVWEPPLGAHGVRWLRYTVDLALDALGTTLAQSVVEALDVVGDALDNSKHIHQFDLGPGDVLLADNRRCLHARTAITSPERSDRLLLRTKVSRNSRPRAASNGGSGE